MRIFFSSPVANILFGFATRLVFFVLLELHTTKSANQEMEGAAPQGPNKAQFKAVLSATYRSGLVELRGGRSEVVGMDNKTWG